MKVYQYESYVEYIRTQRNGYRAKKKMLWAREGNIAFIADKINDRKKKLAICHGVRGGKEVQWFHDCMPTGSFIFGTEIGKPSEGMTFRWDFNKKNPAWLHVADFIYSNAFDHSFDPLKTLEVWKEQLYFEGVLAIELSSNHAKEPTKLDPVSIEPDELARMMMDVGFDSAHIFALPEKVADSVTNNCVVFGRCL